ncbi:hypothetical protein DFH05DRAFT_1457571 [Lentinula detonsa]|uniref:VPS37 C-terminal domain-containing protein n=2 Tax=Lentinula TaxID=5352 RepID=A0A9W8P4W6_9AGAR|nr:hypothetical protein DFH05DRAFT_1457571 [Lentinula detonsa]
MSTDVVTQLTMDFPELAYLSRQDLEDLLNDTNYFQAVFHSLPRVKAMYDAQAELGNANESIARNNLALQEKLYKLRSETQEAFNEAKSLEARWKDLEKEQRDVYQRFTPQFLHMRLRHSVTAQDDASERLATAFIQHQSLGPSETQSGTATPSGKEIDDFIKEFKEARKIYHKRVIWSDRWSKVSRTVVQRLTSAAFGKTRFRARSCAVGFNTYPRFCRGIWYLVVQCHFVLDYPPLLTIITLPSQMPSQTQTQSKAT